MEQPSGCPSLQSLLPQLAFSSSPTDGGGHNNLVNNLQCGLQPGSGGPRSPSMQSWLPLPPVSDEAQYYDAMEAAIRHGGAATGLELLEDFLDRCCSTGEDVCKAAPWGMQALKLLGYDTEAIERAVLKGDS